MISQSTPKDPDLHSLLQYEGIDLYKISFVGGEVMKEKSFRLTVTKEYKALNTDDYSLRNIAEESKREVGYNKKFYLLTYILPYKLQDGSKSWCAVGNSGKDIENWGQRFGVEHYLIFEMEFE